MLLDCWSIPSVMLLTRIFLKTKYRLTKITGAVFCIAGLILVIFSDVHAGQRSGRWLFMYLILTPVSYVVHLNTCKHSFVVQSLSLFFKIICLSKFWSHPLLPLVISNICLYFYISFLMLYVHAIGGSNPRKGDLLVVAGAILYAISNVSEVSWMHFFLLSTHYTRFMSSYWKLMFM